MSSAPEQLPPGLRKPWTWIQPQGDAELLERLHDGFDLMVHERERENLCSVAYERLAVLMYESAERDALRQERDKLREALANLIDYAAEHLATRRAAYGEHRKEQQDRIESEIATARGLL